MFKKKLSFLFSLFLVLCMTGCSGGNTSDNKSTSNNKATNNSSSSKTDNSSGKGSDSENSSVTESKTDTADKSTGDADNSNADNKDSKDDTGSESQYKLKIVKHDITDQDLEFDGSNTRDNNMFDENGLARLAKIVDSKRKYGFVNKSGEWVIEPVYDSASKFSEGWSAVSTDTESGYINTKGEWVIKLDGAHGEAFSNGYAVIKEDKTNLYGYIDISGEQVIKPQFKKAYAFAGNGIAMVMSKEDSKYGYIDTNGEFVVKAQFKAAESFSEGLACVSYEEGGPFGFIDENGNTVIDMQYKLACGFRDGLAEVQENDLSGFIDKTGKKVVECQFREVRSFYDGLAAVAVIGSDGSARYGYADKDYNIVIEPTFNNSEDFYEGLASVVIDGNRCYINTKGKILFEVGAKYGTGFHDGTALIEGDDAKHYYVIDRKGNILSYNEFPEGSIYDFRNIIQEPTVDYIKPSPLEKVMETFSYTDGYFYLAPFASNVKNDCYDIIDTKGNIMFGDSMILEDQ